MHHCPLTGVGLNIQTCGNHPSPWPNMGPVWCCWISSAQHTVTFLEVSRGTGIYQTAPSTSCKFLSVTHKAIFQTTRSTASANTCLLLKGCEVPPCVPSDFLTLNPVREDRVKSLQCDKWGNCSLASRYMEQRGLKAECSDSKPSAFLLNHLMCTQWIKYWVPKFTCLESFSASLLAEPTSISGWWVSFHLQVHVLPRTSECQLIWK